MPLVRPIGVELEHGDIPYVPVRMQRGAPREKRVPGDVGIVVSVHRNAVPKVIGLAGPIEGVPLIASTGVQLENHDVCAKPGPATERLQRGRIPVAEPGVWG